jgi:hypothetical protein
MIKTRLATAAAAALFGLAAITGTVLTCATPANATSGAPSDSTSSTEPSANASSGAPSANGSNADARDSRIAQPKPLRPETGQPFSKDPYPQVNDFPGLPGNPWSE